MATISQLLKTLENIEKTKDKLDKLIDKRNEIADGLNIKNPSFGDQKTETLMVIEGKPSRIWRYYNGSISIETLEFN